MTATEAVTDYAASLPLGAHAVFFYDTKDVAAKVFAAYINGGVHREEATYLISPSRERYEEILELAGVKIDPLEKEGYLHQLSTVDFYFEGEHLTMSKVSESLRNVIRKTRESGFRGSRIIGLTTSLLEYSISPEDLVEYETALGKTLPSRLSSICSYDGRKLLEYYEGHEAFVGLLKAHGHNIFQGVAFPRTNKKSE